MDEPATPTPRSRLRRTPRAAGARKAATALSVAAMLSLGGAIAWRDGRDTTTTQIAATSTKGADATSTTSTGATSATASTSASASASTSSSESVVSHTTTSGS